MFHWQVGPSINEQQPWAAGLAIAHPSPDGVMASNLAASCEYMEPTFYVVKTNEKPSISSCATDDTLLGTFTFQDKISGPVSYLHEKMVCF